MPQLGGAGVFAAGIKKAAQGFVRGGGCKAGRFVALTALLPSCADLHEIWAPQPPGAVRACPGLHMDCFTSVRTQPAACRYLRDFRFLRSC